MEPDPAAVDAAIEGLYAAFAARRPDRAGDFCTHCIEPADDARLRATPLRELDPDLLASFLMSGGTWGSVADLRWILPRAIEAMTHGELWTDPGLTIRTIGRAEPAGLDPPEVEALRAWAAAWLPVLATDPDAGDLDVTEVAAELRALRLIAPGPLI